MERIGLGALMVSVGMKRREFWRRQVSEVDEGGED